MKTRMEQNGLQELMGQAFGFEGLCVQHHFMTSVCNELYAVDQVRLLTELMVEWKLVLVSGFNDDISWVTFEDGKKLATEQQDFFCVYSLI